MNRTTEGSKRMQVVAGGQTIPFDDGKIEIPPKSANVSNEVLNNIILGEYSEISVKGNDERYEKFMKNLKDFKSNRDRRKTKTALKRRMREEKLNQKQEQIGD